MKVTITVDQASRHITRITRTVDDIAPERPVWRFRWQVEYELRSINDRKVSVPVRARYENCQKSSGRCDVNKIVFSDYREFGSIATIRFADVGPSAQSPASGTGSSRCSNTPEWSCGRVGVSADSHRPAGGRLRAFRTAHAGTSLTTG